MDIKDILKKKLLQNCPVDVNVEEEVLKKLDYEESIPIGNFNYIAYPSFLLALPFNLSTDDPNNVWMKELPPEKRIIDLENAFSQFIDFYTILSTSSLVLFLPSFVGLQDEVYVANLGICPPSEPHLVILSNFRSKPRWGEEEVGKKFFEYHDYKIFKPPYFFEGEAELKYINKNNYVGGYGIRSDIRAFYWMMDNFNMNVIPVKETDEKLYHLDCYLFPIDIQNAIVCTEVLSKEDVAKIEKYVNVISIPKEEAYEGTTNSVRVNRFIVNATKIDGMKATDEKYVLEKKRIANLERICVKLGYDPIFVNISEFEKSGALLSCCIMHLNYWDYVKEPVADFLAKSNKK